MWLFLGACGVPAPPPVPALPPVPPQFVAHDLLPEDGQLPGLTHVRPVAEGAVLTDAIRGTVSTLSWREGAAHLVPWELPAGLVPVRTAQGDLDGDGHPEQLVVDIGVLWPSEQAIGSVRVVEENDFVWTLADQLARPVGAEPADLDQDGDLDVLIAEFGDRRGRLAWWRQDDGRFAPQVLHPDPGTTHAWPVDLNGDGALDVAALVSQLDEEVRIYLNRGEGAFEERVVLAAGRTDWGACGLWVADLDGDADADLLVTHGDTMDQDLPPGTDPHQHYGLLWLENDGEGHFIRRDLVSMWGAYAAAVGDLDGDGDLDLALATHQLPSHHPDRPRMPALWLERVDQGYQRHDLPQGAPQSMALGLVDLDRDGDLDLVGGSLPLDQERGVRLRWLENRPGR